MRKSWRRTCSDLVVLFHFDLVTTSSSEGHTEMTDMTWQKWQPQVSCFWCFSVLWGHLHEHGGCLLGELGHEVLAGSVPGGEVLAARLPPRHCGVLLGCEDGDAVATTGPCIRVPRLNSKSSNCFKLLQVDFPNISKCCKWVKHDIAFFFDQVDPVVHLSCLAD